MLRKKRMLSISLSILLSLAVLAGCQPASKSSERSGDTTNTNNTASTNNTNSSGTNNIDLSKKHTIKVFLWGPREIAKDDAIIQQLNQKFNIDLKVERVLAKEYGKNLEVRIASGDIPDIFRYEISKPDVYKHLYEDGYLMNFVEYADKYQLKDLSDYMNHPEMNEFKEQDGMYQLPSYPGQVVAPILIRQDWFDQLGLAHPKTWDEFQKDLQVIQDKKLGGNKTVGVVSSFGFYGGAALSSVGWTGANEWGKVNDAWTYEKVMPEYKGFLQFWRDMYQKGVLDREIFTNNESQEHAKFTSGQAAAIITAADRVAVLQKTLTDTNPNAKLSILYPWPEGPKGPLYATGSPYTSPVVAVKKGKDEDFLARVAMLTDYLHSEEGINMLNFGIEGTHYNMDNGKMVRTEAYNRDIIPATGNLLAFFTDYSLAKQDVDDELKKVYADATTNAIAPPFTTLSYGNEANLMPTITLKQQEWVVKFVTDTATDIDKGWDTYLKELKNAGLDKLTQTIQEKNK